MLSRRTRLFGRGLPSVVLLLLIPAIFVVFTRRAGAQSPPTAPHTLAEALALADQSNRLIAVARLRIAEARGDLTGASLSLVDNPDLSVEAGPRIPGSGAAVSPNLGLGVAQRLEIGGQRRHRIDRAQAQIAAAEASVEEVARVVARAVAIRFWRALAASRQLKIRAEDRRLAESLVEVARRRLKAGAGTPLEVNAARIRLAESQRKWLDAQTVRLQAAIRLATLLGLPPGTQVDLVGKLPSAAATSSVEVLAAAGLERRPELVVAARAIEAADALIALADAQVWPSLTVGLAYGLDDGDHTLTAQLRLPLPLFNANEGARQRARAERARRQAEKEALELTVARQVREAFVAYDQARQIVALYDSEVLRAQQESMGMLQKALDAGQADISQVIVLQRSVLEGREAYLQARLDFAEARANLLAATHQPQTRSLHGGQP